MERYTKKDKYGNWYTDFVIYDRSLTTRDGIHFEKDKDIDAYDGDPIDKLAEYEDLEEQGLLHKAPLKNGTPIWVVVDDYVDEELYLICESYQYGYSEYMYGEYNQNFFKSKEQAEEMIKELNGEFDE